MGAGHYAAAVMLARAGPRVNTGLLCLCAIAGDVLLGIFVLAGIEEVHIPPSFPARHYFEFTFPYSHGLAATLVWTAVAVLIVRYWLPWPAAFIAGAAVLSHFVLDVIVHVPEIPVAGEDSRKLGLALWDRLSLALSIETALVLAAIVLAHGAGLRILLGIVGAVMIGGQALMNAAPKANVLAWNWIVTGLAISAIAFVLDRKKRRAETRRPG